MRRRNQRNKENLKKYYIWYNFQHVRRQKKHSDFIEVDITEHMT